MQAVLTAHPECQMLVLVDHTDTECTVRRVLSGPRDHWPDRAAIDNLRECCLLAFRESARGSLPKASEPDRLVSALRAIAHGEVWAGPGLSQYLVDIVRPEEHEQKQRLTKRELDVVGLLVEGLSNKEIAARLSLSEQTIKNHIARIMVKVEVRNRVELVLYAVRERLA
jgi:DNA-binding NarL/FixJ family response regulator